MASNFNMRGDQKVCRKVLLNRIAFIDCKMKKNIFCKLIEIKIKAI